VFVTLLDAIARSLVEKKIDCVAGDATEGFNPTHDLCRTLINAAVLMAERATLKPIANYEFRLTEWEQNRAECHDAECVHLRLDDELLERKVNAAQNYAELRDEVEQAITCKGKEYFRLECLRKTTITVPYALSFEKPYYETWGEQRVAEGKYNSVVRYGEHVLPIMHTLRVHAEMGLRIAAPARC
jgi:hypothetical protein